MLTHCRICGSNDLFKFLDLGFTPPADQFLKTSQLKEPETYYPLNVFMCRKCSLAQLDYVVPPEVLYKHDYPYESSMTKSGQLHWDEFARTVCKTYNVCRGDLVVDIGSNVGVLLGSFKENGADILGIDPASNIVSIANKRGIETWDEFFTSEIARRVLVEKGKAKIITGTNVFAHVNDLKNFMKAIDILLDEKGVFIFEAPYFGNLIKFIEYDTIYHEHLSYFLLEPVIHLVEQRNMEVVDVQERDIHGGSFRVFIARKGKHKATKDVENFIENERNAKWQDQIKLMDFSDRVQKNRKDLHRLIYGLKLKGKKLAAVSAPAKGMTLLNYCHLGSEIIEFLTEKSTLKIGRFCPGVHIPVVGDEELINQNVDYALLLAWNFSEEIIANLKDYKEKGGKFIIPIPEPRIV